MQIKDMFDTLFDNLEDKTLQILKDKKDQTSLILDNFYNNTLEQLSDILNKNQVNDIKQELKYDIIKELKQNLNDIENSTKEVVINMNKYTKEIVTSNYKNYLFNLNVSDVVIKESKNKVGSINYLNKDFIKKYDNIFELFLYSIATEYKLKNNINTYNLILKTINQNKKILFDNFKLIEDKTKEDIIYEYEHCFNTFTTDVIGFKEGLNKKNSKLLIEYQEELLNSQVILNIKKTLENDSKKIEQALETCHSLILKIEKGRNTKIKELELNILTNFLLSFNNTLFDKAQNTLLKIMSIASRNTEELEKNIKRYNDIIYKLCDFEYNFDKPFLLYKQKMLNRTYFLTTKQTEEIISIIEETKIEVINIIKTSVVEVFENNINLLNKVTYKRLMCEHKLQNYYNILDKKLIEKLLD